jgi:ATP phosphoribosyltransferase regulatory subunit
MKVRMPKGVKDLLPADVEERGRVAKKMQNVFKDAGYRRIITPTVELYDVLKRGMGQRIQKMSIRFFDHNGDLMILRPDMTTPVARVVATRMQENNDIKLYYTSNVYRQSPKSSGKDAEFTQIGIESMGKNGVEADAEVLELAILAMKAIGLKNFKIDIGHISMLENMTDEQINALEAKDYVKFGQIPLVGKEEVSEKLPYFKELLTELKKRNIENYIQFNLGLVKDIGYYTGLVFECFVNEVGYLIGGGGRYDGLVGSYGAEKPAVGFAFSLDRLLLALEEERNQ